MKGNLGSTSLKRLSTCCHPLYETVTVAANHPDNPCEFGVACGGRGKADQNKAYFSGHSAAEWGESFHNVMCGDNFFSMAVDVWPYDNIRRDYIYDNKELHLKLINHIITVGHELGYNIESGADFKTIEGGDTAHLQISFRAWNHGMV